MPGAPDKGHDRRGRFSNGDHSGADPQDPSQAEEVLENELAAFAFLREEDDREVRLYFRDVPAGELALLFRSAAAQLITITGQRAPAMHTPPAAEANPLAQEQTEVVQPKRKRRRAQAHTQAPGHSADEAGGVRPPRHTGELTLRYFYALEDIVYTVILTSSTGITDSVADIYPGARLAERELQARLAAIFR